MMYRIKLERGAIVQLDMAAPNKSEVIKQTARLAQTYDVLDGKQTKIVSIYERQENNVRDLFDPE